MALDPSSLMEVCLSSSRSRSSSGCGRDCLVNVTTERGATILIGPEGDACGFVSPAFLWIMLESRCR
jgi:hypothetical protein